MKILRMRKNKAIVIALIVLAFAVALTACGGNGGGNAGGNGEESGAANSDAGGAEAATASEAYALYKSASEALSNAEGYTMDVDIDMATGDDESANINTTSHMEVSNPAGNIGMKLVQTTGYAGENMESTIYIKDDGVYTEMLGTKVKMTMDIPELLKQSNNMVEFPEDAIIDGGVTDVEGGKQITFKIKGDALKEYVDQQIGDLTGGVTDDYASDENAGEDAVEGASKDAGENATEDASEGAVETGEDLGMTFEDSTVTALIGPDGNFVEYTTEMSFSMTLGEDKTSMSQKSTVTNITIGKVAIDFPSDLDSYEELDLGNLGDVE
jgi:hypothetical protein